MNFRARHFGDNVFSAQRLQSISLNQAPRHAARRQTLVEEALSFPEIIAMQESPFTTERLVEICIHHDVAMLGSLIFIEVWDEDDELDLYVRFSKKKSPATAITLERHLTETLQRPVQLLTEESLTPHMRIRVLKDVEVLYEV